MKLDYFRRYSYMVYWEYSRRVDAECLENPASFKMTSSNIVHVLLLFSLMPDYMVFNGKTYKVEKDV